MEVGFVNTKFIGEVGHPDRPTDRPGYVPYLGGGASITGQSFGSCDLPLLRNRSPNTEVVSRTVHGAFGCAVRSVQTCENELAAATGRAVSLVSVPGRRGLWFPSPPARARARRRRGAF